VRAVQQEINLQRRQDDALRDAKKRELAEVARKLNGLIDAIADGLRAPGLQQRLDELEARRVQLEQDLATVPTLAESIGFDQPADCPDRRPESYLKPTLTGRRRDFSD